MKWNMKLFTELTTVELYKILKLRVDTFVIEQRCCYGELDNKDLVNDTRHLWLTKDNGEIIAYLRMLAPGVKFTGAAIGRVLVALPHRRTGLGKQVMYKA